MMLETKDVWILEGDYSDDITIYHLSGDLVDIKNKYYDYTQYFPKLKFSKEDIGFCPSWFETTELEDIRWGRNSTGFAYIGKSPLLNILYGLEEL